MRKWIVRLVVVLGLVGLWLLLRATVLAPEPVVVDVIAVARGLVEETVTNTRAGTVTARRRAQLSPETSGLVVELPSRRGAVVQAGEALLRMDASAQEAQVRLAQSALEVARARYAESCVVARRAERELARNRALAAGNLISDDVLDRLESSKEAAEASCATSAAAVAEAEARVLLAEAELAKTAIRAPFSGIVAELSVELGEFVTPAPPGVPIPPLIDLLDPSSIYVAAPMDEVDSAKLSEGLRARVTLDPLPERSFAGRVVRVAPYVLDLLEQNRTVEIEVELAQAELAQRLLPGTSADVEVILEEKDEVLRIPTAALLEGGRVLVLRDGRLEERRVGTGLRNWDWTEVTSDLALGELVVLSLGDTAVVPGAAAVARGEARR